MAVQTAVMFSGAPAGFHPFFSKASGRGEQIRPTEEISSIEQGERGVEEEAPATTTTEQLTTTSSRKATSKSRSTKVKPAGKSQFTIGQLFGHAQPQEDPLPVQGTELHDATSGSDSGRRKRLRRSLDVGDDSSEPTVAGCSGVDNTTPAQVPAAVLDEANCEPLPSLAPGKISTPPKKMLKLNARGKFSSPIAKTTKIDEEITAEKHPKRRGRPPKSKQAQRLIACVRYAVKPNTDETSSVGSQIDQILAGHLKVDLPQQQLPATPTKPRTPRKPAKATHPFFVDKAKLAKAVKPATPRKTAAITPGKIRVQAQHERGVLFKDTFPIVESALLKDRLMVKHAGAKEPSWPAKGMAHVRGDLDYMVLAPTLQRRKYKHKLPVAATSLLSQYTQHLVPEPETRLRPDGFHEPRPELRIPERLLICGAEIAMLALKEIHAPLSQGSVDELALDYTQEIHPAIHHLYQSIPAHMSAFDHLRGEQYGWAQKYAPERAEAVLQPPKEMQVLKSWLQSLAVNTVVVAKPVDSMDSISSRPRKKRKIRRSELDDFIVDEDEDMRSMNPISEGSCTLDSQSVVQTSMKGVRASNAVLISGPHGCGKTAAVYAVAKELQYQVFEISSSDRRAGKDVLDKIGNVTENHIVKRNVPDGEADTEDKDRIDAAFKQDLENGRQGKMSAFFKPAAAKASSKSKPAAVVKAKFLKNVKSAVTKASKEQQQSLILLEEVDVLFKEDKEFWTTILKLVTTSKRPFIITCNDEDMVPVQALTTHAILRFTSTTPDTAIDYLLLIAAREGHLLQRRAVSHLWQESGHDLRRSLTTLDFWCRMGVGDIRDGLGWIYQRWPIGSDLDVKGRPFRVVSKGTYQAGMGSVEAPAKVLPLCTSGKETLKNMDAALQALSSIDMLSRTYEVDPTLPPLPQQHYAQYVEGLALLDAQESVDHTGLRSEIETTCNQLLQKCFPHAQDQPDDTTMLTRKSFAAFDALAYPSASASTAMEASVLDGPFASVVLEVAPYVRQVVRYEQMLQEHRSAIAGSAKRARKTRAARSALEGGQRQLTRKEHWWEGTGDLRDVLSTAGNDWSLPNGRDSTPVSTVGSVAE